MAPLLELDDVSARYGPIAALHGVSLTVDDGEIVAILGANGAGKTTTLRAVSGMVRRAGSIVFGGRRLRGSPESTARAGIAHVPEGRGIFAELTVWENLRMGAYVRRGKPDPEPYLKGAALLGLPASECVVFEDAPAGIRAAKLAGTRVIALPTTESEKELKSAGADWILPGYSNLSLEFLNGPGLKLRLTP